MCRGRISVPAFSVLVVLLARSHVVLSWTDIFPEHLPTDNIPEQRHAKTRQLTLPLRGRKMGCCVDRVGDVWSLLSGGNVAQRQSGRFISVRSQVRIPPLPPRTCLGQGRLAQPVRASRSHREGHWFESNTAHHCRPAAPSPKWRNGRRATFRA